MKAVPPTPKTPGGKSIFLHNVRGALVLIDPTGAGLRRDLMPAGNGVFGLQPFPVAVPARTQTRSGQGADSGVRTPQEEPEAGRKAEPDSRATSAAMNEAEGAADQLARIMLIWVEARDRWNTAREMQARLDAWSELKLLVRTPQGLVASPLNNILEKIAKTMLRACQDRSFTGGAASPADRAGRHRSLTRGSIRGRCCD